MTENWAGEDLNAPFDRTQFLLEALALVDRVNNAGLTLERVRALDPSSPEVGKTADTIRLDIDEHARVMDSAANSSETMLGGVLACYSIQQHKKGWPHTDPGSQSTQ